MKPKQVKVFAPVTIANVGPGFDVLGIALEQPGDIVIASRTEELGLQFRLHDSKQAVPNNKNNVAAHVAQLIIDELKPPFGIMMSLQKGMPSGSGLGSSGASSAAAALAVNALLPAPLSKLDLIHFAMQGEYIASGSAHADNVAPSLLGGVCLIRSYEPLDVIKIPTKNDFYWVVVHPQLIVNTKDARDCLPTTISMKTAVQQWGNVGALLVGLMLGDSELVGRSLQDTVAEPVRMHLIPGYIEAKQAALHAGAIGFSISGSGPSVFAITTTHNIALQVAEMVKRAFLDIAHLNCDSYISKINQEGAKIMEDTV